MPRVIWKGAISFGLVHVPVSLYPAAQEARIDFDWLDKRSMDPVGYKRVNKRTGKEIQGDDVVKGIKQEDGDYVILSDDQIKAAYPKATQTIEIEAFVQASEIPFILLEKPYYLEPIGKGEKVYALLRETLRATNRVAIAQVVIRTTQHLAAVIVNDRALMLVTMRYQDELRDHKEIELPAAGLKSAGVTAKEVELAKRLIDDMSEHWNPAEFEDTYHEDLMHRIEEKIKRGETAEITEPEKESKEAPKSAQIIDLTELLKKSLRGDKAASTEATAEPRRAAKGAKAAAKTAKAAPAAPSAPGHKAPAKRKRA